MIYTNKEYDLKIINTEEELLKSFEEKGIAAAARFKRHEPFQNEAHYRATWETFVGRSIKSWINNGDNYIEMGNRYDELKDTYKEKWAKELREIHLDRDSSYDVSWER